MLTPSDLVFLPYPPDLTQAGILYACRSLQYTYNRMGGSPFDRLRRIVAGVAVELAFRRHLVAQHVPYDLLGATPFTQPDQYDVSLGGRRVDLKSYQIFQKEKISRVHKNPAYLMDASALVPVDQFVSDQLSEQDLYVFAFSTALVTHHWREIEKAIAAGQPVYLIHPLPTLWTQPGHWASLGRLALKADQSEPVEVEIGGQTADRRFQTELVTLLPKQRTEAQTDFYSVAYLHVLRKPEGRIGVFSPRLDRTYLIEPEAWGNIWVYGMRVILAGFMPRGEFHRQARDLAPNSRVLQYTRTRTRNKSVPLQDLYPFERLVRQAHQWGLSR